jgi:predicted ester cyclase
MTTEENKATVRRFFEELFNQGNLAIADEIVDVDHLDHMLGPDVPRGPASVQEAVRANRALFPDLRFTVEDTIAEGDRVVARVKQRGTQLGDIDTPLGCIPATGSPITIDAILIFRVAGGRLRESWGVFDALSAMKQAGAMLAPRTMGEG